MTRKPYAIHFADDGQRARWEAAAERDGKTLAQFVRDAVDEKVEPRRMPGTAMPLDPQSPRQLQGGLLDGKRSYDPDPKVKSTKPEKSDPDLKFRRGKLR